MSKAVFYHAGCSVCQDAEKQLVASLDPSIDVEIVHLGNDKTRIEEAENFGVESVPAVVLHDNVYHINFGASLHDVKKA